MAIGLTIMHWIGSHWVAAHWMATLPQVAAGAVVSSVWQGLVLAVGVGLCLRLVPRATAAIRFSIWAAVFGVLAVLPFLHGYMGHAEQVLSAHSAMLRVDVRWSFAVAGLWVVVSVVRAGSLMANGVRLHRIWKGATEVEGCEALLAGKGARGVTLCTSSDVDRPSVIGFLSPRILIPVDLFARLTTVELEQIVLHEMGHLRRGDDWINLLQKIGLVVFPLNPALVWIERRLCFERELACDDVVLRSTRAPKAYAKCLTSLAEQRLERRAVSLSLGAWGRKSELTQRVHSILRRGEVMSRGQARFVLGALVLGMLGGAAELSRCPRLVSFTDAGAGVLSSAQVVPMAPGAPMTEYHSVATAVSSGAGQGALAAHETLLKASMPVGHELKKVSPAVHRRSRRSAAPTLRQARASRTPMPQEQQWVVLTSSHEADAYEVQGVSRMVLTVAGERDAFASYAAVPTAVGWLIIQL